MKNSNLKKRTSQHFPKAIDVLIESVVKEIDPLKIIVFGSWARGENKPDSDVDLLVIMPEGIHRRKTAQILYRNIRGVGIPFDLIIATSSDLEKHRNNIGLVYRTILSEGKEVYARRN
ncbi:nucleotidyltransferase domain-containing protein [candidate division KSB1 bacterium]|nr:nucleotidyltransferase domain-containing protein [candidate division KSB1 bacterium]